MIYGLLTPRGLDAASFSSYFYIFIAFFVVLHCCTIVYASLRPELCTVHGHATKLGCKFGNVLPVVGLGFEFAQLAAPFLSADLLGSGGSDPVLSALKDARSVDGFLTLQHMTVESYCHGLMLLVYSDIFLFTITGWVSQFEVMFWLCFALVMFYALSLGFGILVSDAGVRC